MFCHSTISVRACSPNLSTFQAESRGEGACTGLKVAPGATYARVNRMLTLPQPQKLCFFCFRRFLNQDQAKVKVRKGCIQQGYGQFLRDALSLLPRKNVKSRQGLFFEALEKTEVVPVSDIVWKPFLPVSDTDFG